MSKQETLKLSRGLILNYESNKIELDKITGETERKLFNIFSGGDNDLSADDSASLWNKLKIYADKNKDGADDTLDDSEIEQMLEETVNLGEEKFSVAQFKNFLFGIFKKSEKVEFEDDLHLNRDFTELNQRPNIEETAKEIFNPNNLTTVDEYEDSDNKVLKSQTICGKNGQPERVLNYQNGGVVSVDIKKGNKWERTDFTNGTNSLCVYDLSEDKTEVLRSQIFVDGILVSVTQYNPDDSKSYTVTKYYKNGIIKDIKDYVKEKLQSVEHYDEKGNYTGKETLLYDDDNHLIEVSEYNKDDLLKNREDIVNKIRYDADGSVNNNALVLSPDVDLSYKSKLVAKQLVKDLSTENLKLINDKNVLYVLFNIYNNPSENRDLLLAIHNNPDKEVRREQMKIVLDAIKEYAKNNFSGFTPEMTEKFNTMLDECLSDNVSTEKIKKLSKQLINARFAGEYIFLNEMYSDTPNGVIDKMTYQGNTGDCWLLASMLSISELPEGREYLKKFIHNNPEAQTVTVTLKGGKRKFKFSYAEIRDAYNYSHGDLDMRAIEMAYYKYAEKYQINGNDNIHGGNEKYAFQLLEGKEPQTAIVKDGKLGIEIDGNFVEINDANRDLLRYIPIEINVSSDEVLKQLEKIKDYTAITTGSYYGAGGHAYWLHDISSGEAQVTVKEPHNQNNSRTYTPEKYNKTYDTGFTIYTL